jgi:hypothetical protein
MPRFVTQPDPPHSPVRMGIRPAGFLNKYQSVVAGLPWPARTSEDGGTGQGGRVGVVNGGGGGVVDGGGGGGEVIPGKRNLVLYLQRTHGRARGVETENEKALLAAIDVALTGTPYSLRVFNSSGDWRRDRPLFASAAAVVCTASRCV